MVSKYGSQTPASAAAPVQRVGTASLARAGWCILGAAVVLWAASSMSLVYGASLQAGWSLLFVFVALCVVSFVLIGTGGRAVRRPPEEELPQEEPDDATDINIWVEQWERLMQQPVR